MDALLSQLVEFVQRTELSDISPSSMHELIRHNLDGVGCAAGGFDSAPARIVRRTSTGITGPRNASVYGIASPVAVEYAAFANGSMNRYLDFNDAGGAGHPNDMAPAIVAYSEATGKSGLDALLGTYVCYEIGAALARAHYMRSSGFDQGAYCAIATAAGLSKVAGLDAEQTANAISLAILSGQPVRVVRTGVMSHWKGCATGHATRVATLAVELAKAGLTGPPEPFTGYDGFFKLISRRPFEVSLDRPDGQPSAVEMTTFKYYPSELHSQVPIELALEAREKADVADIESIVARTYYIGWHEIGGGQGDADEKWDPKTRETADHSMPYLLAVALTDGDVSLDSFADERITDPRLRPLMQRVKVELVDELTTKFETGLLPASLTFELKDGRSFTLSREAPLGHKTRPLSDDEVNSKFDAMIGKVLRPDNASRLRDLLWHFDSLPTLDEVGTLFRRFELR